MHKVLHRPLNGAWQWMRRRSSRGAWVRTYDDKSYWHPEMRGLDAWTPWGRRWLVDDHAERWARMGLRRIVEYGDVVHVGGAGYGLTMLEALNRGAMNVRGWEPVSRMRHAARRTLLHHDPHGRYLITPGYIGEVKDAWGEVDGSCVDPAELLDCDVLELDVEGGEGAFLRSLDEVPDRLRGIVVESHGFLGVPTVEVVEELARLGLDEIEILGGFEKTDCKNVLARRG